MNSKIFTTIIYSILFFCTSFAQNGKTYTVEKVNGVEVVHNHKPLWGDKPKIALEKVLEIGGIDEEDKNYVFFVSKAIMDKDGNYYIFEVAKQQIKKFNSQGKFIGTIGREGKGPRDFFAARIMGIDKNMNLFAFEIYNQKFKIMQIKKMNSGEVRYSRIIKEGVNSFNFLNNGNAIITHSDDFGGKNKRIFIYDSNFNIINSFLDYTDKPVKEKDEFFGIMSEFNEIKLDVDKNDNIYVAEVNTNEIYKYSDKGNLIKKFDRKLNYDSKPIWVTVKYEKEYERIISKDKRRNFYWVTGTTRILKTDYLNRIWIETRKEAVKKPDEIKIVSRNYYEVDIQLEIFNDEGILLATIDPFGKKDLKMLGIFGDKILFTDTERVTFYVYKIVEK